MCELKEYIADLKTLKIVIVDDEKSSNMLLKKKLSKSIEGAKIIARNMPEHLYFDLAHEKPLIVVVDWNYPRYDCSVILERLENYKGLICVFSNENINVIKSKIVECLGAIPPNFRVIHKSNYRVLKSEIDNYINRKKGKHYANS